jgi:hypothetical protein
MERMIVRTALVLSLFVSAAPSAVAHLGAYSGTGEGGNRVLNAFTHWPPTIADTHYYAEAIFFVTVIVLFAVDLTRRYRKKSRS